MFKSRYYVNLEKNIWFKNFMLFFVLIELKYINYSIIEFGGGNGLLGYLVFFLLNLNSFL